MLRLALIIGGIIIGVIGTRITDAVGEAFGTDRE